MILGAECLHESAPRIRLSLSLRRTLGSRHENWHRGTRPRGQINENYAVRIFRCDERSYLKCDGSLADSPRSDDRYELRTIQACSELGNDFQLDR